jgi:hypothetical protein
MRERITHVETSGTEGEELASEVGCGIGRSVEKI